jgi:hypothetical protein
MGVLLPLGKRTTPTFPLSCGNNHVSCALELVRFMVSIQSDKVFDISRFTFDESKMAIENNNKTNRCRNGQSVVSEFNFFLRVAKPM